VINLGVKDDVVRLIVNPALRERVPATAMAASDSVGQLLKAGTFTALTDLLRGSDSATVVPPATK
jgi:simple sugar transport system substrate-binding protein/basic membrane protein A